MLDRARACVCVLCVVLVEFYFLLCLLRFIRYRAERIPIQTETRNSFDERRDMKKTNERNMSAKRKNRKKEEKCEDCAERMCSLDEAVCLYVFGCVHDDCLVIIGAR